MLIIFGTQFISLRKELVIWYLIQSEIFEKDWKLKIMQQKNIHGD